MLTDPSPLTQEHPAQDPNSESRCIKCGTLLNDAQALCPQCRHYVSKEGMLYQSPYPRAHRRCHLCGWRTGMGEKHCARCGQPLNRRFNTIGMTSITVGLTLILIGGALVVYGCFMSFVLADHGLVTEAFFAALGIVLVLLGTAKIREQL